MILFNNIKRSGIFIIPGLLFFIVLGCGNKQEQQLRPIEGGVQTSSFDAAEKMTTLLRLQEQIVQAPEQIERRRELLAAAIDPTQQKAYAVGTGKPPAAAASSAMAQQSAERAAFIDGARWLAYINAWRHNIEQPAFGAIQGSVPASRLAHKNTTAEQTVVLVEMELH
jgi:hypothetical protein